TAAFVVAQGNVLVSAEDDTTLDQVSGNIAGAGTGAAGVAAGIGVLTKHTEAYINNDAQVTGLAREGGDRQAILANTGGFKAPLAFSSVASSQITIANHGLATGDEVVFNSDNAPSGLINNPRYFVIRDDADHFHLADSLAHALIGQVVVIGAVPAGSTQT